MMYAMSDEQRDRVNKDFTYHAPKSDQTPRYEVIRDVAKQYAKMLMENCPPSRELSLALTHLEECVFYANASIARNE